MNFAYLVIVFSSYFVALNDSAAEESRFHFMLVIYGFSRRVGQGPGKTPSPPYLFYQATFESALHICFLNFIS